MYMKRIVIPILSGIIFISACEEKRSPTETGTDPVIQGVNLKKKWNTNSAQRLYQVEVQATDPQGFRNLDYTRVSVLKQGEIQPLFSDTLYDDGAYQRPEDGDQRYYLHLL